MSDPRQTLTPHEVEAAGLADWRMLLHTIKARFRSGSFATGLALVDRIGAAAETANHHPDITLTHPEVIVTLSSHDVGGVTSRDLDLARMISGYAAELGCAADPGGLTQVEMGLDTARAADHAPFYAALFGAQVKNGEVVDRSGQCPTVWWQEPGSPQDEGALPDSGVEQRWHLDVWVPVDEGPRRVQAAVDAGGRLVSDAAAPTYWVLEDAEGNRSCICTSAARGNH